MSEGTISSVTLASEKKTTTIRQCKEAWDKIWWLIKRCWWNSLGKWPFWTHLWRTSAYSCFMENYLPVLCENTNFFWSVNFFHFLAKLFWEVSSSEMRSAQSTKVLEVVQVRQVLDTKKYTESVQTSQLSRLPLDWYFLCKWPTFNLWIHTLVTVCLWIGLILLWQYIIFKLTNLLPSDKLDVMMYAIKAMKQKSNKQKKDIL